jgi:group I intron endonuclease
MKLGHIYKIVSPTGRIYIGQTRRLSNRISCYKTKGAINQHILNASLKKYGFDNHVFSIVEECSVDLLNEKEIFYIKEFNSFHYDHPDIGMNLTIGGGGTNGHKMSKEVIERQSKKKLEEWNNPEYKERMRKVHTGYKMTEQQYNKTVTAVKNRWKDPVFKAKMLAIFNSDEFKEKQRKIKLGKKMSEEHKRKTSEASLKHWKDPEYRIKVIPNDERKQCISEQMKERYYNGKTKIDKVTGRFQKMVG